MYRFASWATLCTYRFATGVPARYAGLLCVRTGSLQAYLNDMLGYFVYVQGRVEKETIPNATLFTTKMTPVLRWAAMVAFSPDPQCTSKLASQVVYFRNPSGGT